MACEGQLSRISQGLRFFDSLFLAGKGLLAFQGLSRGDGLLNCRLSIRQDGSGRNDPCRPAGRVKSRWDPIRRLAHFRWRTQGSIEHDRANPIGYRSHGRIP